MLIQRHINPEISCRNKIRTIFPEELVTQFKIEMVHFVAQAYNIDAIRPQLQTLSGIKN